MSKEQSSKENKRDLIYAEPPWARKFLERKGEIGIIEKGHEQLAPLKIGKDWLKSYHLTGREEAQLRAKLNEAQPDLIHSDLTLKQRAMLYRVVKKLRARKLEGRGRREIR
jgi:hypothetical protein